MSIVGSGFSLCCPRPGGVALVSTSSRRFSLLLLEMDPCGEEVQGPCPCAACPDLRFR